MQLKNDLSLIIITKNSSRNIQKTITSIAQDMREIIIIDCGSTDETIGISKKYTNKIYNCTFHNDFSEIRNFGISKATGEWILVLDSDEELSNEARKRIRTLAANDDIDGYWFRRKTYISDTTYLKHGLFYPDYQLRLFRNKKKYAYHGRVHEELNIPKNRTQEIPVDILHHPIVPKYDSVFHFRNLIPYIRLAAMSHREKRYAPLFLIWKAIYSFIDMFFIGLTRGKGILDGWPGIRAHFLFAFSVSAGYIAALGDTNDHRS